MAESLNILVRDVSSRKTRNDVLYAAKSHHAHGNCTFIQNMLLGEDLKTASFLITHVSDICAMQKIRDTAVSTQ